MTRDESLKFYVLDTTSRAIQELKARIDRLSCFKAAELEMPEGHTLDVPSTLAVTGWNRHDDLTVDCMFKCSIMIPVDKNLHPILEHRWCCPVVLPDPSQEQKSGWKGLS